MADVLEILRQRVRDVETRWGFPEGSDKVGRDAIDKVAELIAAVERYEKNCARLKREHPGDDPLPSTELDLHVVLKSQMFAALAAMKEPTK